jgi:hypothetical protein
MEENDISLFHFKIDAIAFNSIVILYSEVGLIYLTIPIRIRMLEKGSFLSFRQNIQTAVICITVLESCPSCHYLVCGAKWKIGKILVEGMP